MAKHSRRIAFAAGDANPAYRHGHTCGGFSPTYQSWSSMVQRCTNPRRPYWRRYGGRGVRVYDRWLVFDNFLEDMGVRPDGTALDRWPDRNGDYTPENCRWASRTAQNRNTSQALYVDIGDERRCLTDWCDIYQISVETVRSRAKRGGWRYQTAITTPVDVRKRPRRKK